MEKYISRHEAGRILAEQLRSYSHNPDVIVLALPRGGVPVGYEIAKALGVPLDVFVVRKLGVPGHEELAMGAIAPQGVMYLNQDLIKDLSLSQKDIRKIKAKEQQELKRREAIYRYQLPPPMIEHKVVILVDDGIATGATMYAAIHAIKEEKPARLIIAVPVAAYSTYQDMINCVDEVICPLQPINFSAVGFWYSDFAQTTDLEVAELLNVIRTPTNKKDGDMNETTSDE